MDEVVSVVAVDTAEEFPKVKPLVVAPSAACGAVATGSLGLGMSTTPKEAGKVGSLGLTSLRAGLISVAAGVGAYGIR